MTEIMEQVETRDDLKARLARDVMQIRDQLFRLAGVPGDEWPIETAAWELTHILSSLLDEGVAPESAQGWTYNARSLALLAETVPLLRKRTRSK